jgi:hypothetical protein
VYLDKKGDKLGAVRARAEEFATQLDYSRAIDALTSWQALSDKQASASSIDEAIVSVRIQQLQTLLK